MTAATSLRAQIKLLDSAGELLRVHERIGSRFEAAAIAQRISRAGGPAVMFENVDDLGIPVVLGTDATRERVALSLGAAPREVIDVFARALDQPIAPVVVESGPVQEVVRTGGQVDLRRLPILTHFENDAGPYITSGMVVAEDPESGIRNVSYHRMQVVGRDELRVVIVPRHLYAIQEKFERTGRALPVAVVVGADSAVRLAAGTSGSAVPLGFDEFGISGGLRGNPEHLVRCVSNGVHVPANAELVIEGEILAGVRRSEGPFAEFAGFYKPASDRHVLSVTAITHRADPIYQGLISGSEEQLLLMGLPNEPAMMRSIRGGVPGALSIHVTSGGLFKFHVILSIEKRHEGDGKDAIIAAFAAHRDVKMVTVVDADVDPFDLHAVERAVATWFQADRDMVIVSGGKANPVERQQGPGGTTSRLGMDATASLIPSGDMITRARIPGADELDLSRFL